MAPLRTVTVRGMSQVITTTVIAVLILLLHLRVLLLVVAIVAKIAAIPMPAALSLLLPNATYPRGPKPYESLYAQLKPTASEAQCRGLKNHQKDFSNRI